MADLYPVVFPESRAMLFVDGENFAMRYGEMRKAWHEVHGDNAPNQKGGLWYEPNVALWAQVLNPQPAFTGVRLVRRHFYTSVLGSNEECVRIEQWLKDRGFEAPRVFHRDKSRGSKQVD